MPQGQHCSSLPSRRCRSSVTTRWPFQPGHRGGVDAGLLLGGLCRPGMNTSWTLSAGNHVHRADRANMSYNARGWRKWKARSLKSLEQRFLQSARYRYPSDHWALSANLGALAAWALDGQLRGCRQTVWDICRTGLPLWQLVARACLPCMTVLFWRTLEGTCTGSLQSDGFPKGTVRLQSLF
jgi:hypothetical protein